MPELIVTKDIDAPGLDTLDGYREYGGYQALEKALKEYQPDELVELVKKSGLRGRGGAGFPTGLKWSFLAKNDKPRYLCCNADESEPGTFKDRMLMEKNPHQLIEGVIITSYACRVSTAFIYVRGELALAGRQIARAIDVAVSDPASGLALQAARQRDQALAVLGQDLLVDAGLVVHALHLANGAELHQVDVALVVRGEEGEVVGIPVDSALS